MTDDNGGTWTLQPPTVGGSSQAYVASVLGDEPLDYWRLGDSGTSDAVNQVAGGTATYNNVTQGVTGRAVRRHDDRLAQRHDLLPRPAARSSTRPGTRPLCLWFKTTDGGGRAVLVLGGHAAHRQHADGLRALALRRLGRPPERRVLERQRWTRVESTAVVDDGKWHNVVLAAGASSQTLYVDGTARRHPVRQRRASGAGSDQRLRRRRVHRRQLARRGGLRDERQHRLRQLLHRRSRRRVLVQRAAERRPR